MVYRENIVMKLINTLEFDLNQFPGKMQFYAC